MERRPKSNSLKVTIDSKNVIIYRSSCRGRMTADDLSLEVSELSQQLEELDKNAETNELQNPMETLSI